MSAFWVLTHIFEEIFEHAAKQATGSTTAQHGDFTVELARPWKRMKLIDAVEEVGGVPAETWTDFDSAMSLMDKKLKCQFPCQCIVRFFLQNKLKLF